jgi:hypothetical protein
MIQFPRRSVTRFFIPLIDVLTLLFCIFLLMPMIKPAGETQESTDPLAPHLARGDAARAPSARSQQTESPSLNQRDRDRSEAGNLEREREELERLRNEKIQVLQQRLFIRVLEIDPDTGKLYYREPDGVREIASQADALGLITRNQREAGGRELYYLFLFPRRLTGYPEQKQLERYHNWFKGVAHGTDNPLSER